MSSDIILDEEDITVEAKEIVIPGNIKITADREIIFPGVLKIGPIEIPGFSGITNINGTLEIFGGHFSVQNEVFARMYLTKSIQDKNDPDISTHVEISGNSIVFITTTRPLIKGGFVFRKGKIQVFDLVKEIQKLRSEVDALKAKIPP